jgi:prepilin-type N-terminal cleavage/methylation domain-containing protein
MRNRFENRQTGFSLVELMVSVSIIVLVMGTVLAKHNKSNGAVLLRSQAFEVALTAREVQLQAVSAIHDGTSFRHPLGLSFDIVADPGSFAIFSDTDADQIFDASEIFGEQGRLDRRFEIDDIRLITGVVVSSVTELTILFERPNFDARFFSAAGVENTTASVAEIDIRLSGTTGYGPESVRTVEITRTGQITVQ